MPVPKIVVYFKPMCGWNLGVEGVLEKYGLTFEKKNVIEDRKAFAEMLDKTQQSATPCVEIDGVMLADVGGQEVEDYLKENGLVYSNPVGS
jgi:glutaredoxin